MKVKKFFKTLKDNWVSVAVIYLLITSIPLSYAAYTHFSRVSSETGYSIGVAGSEVEVIDSSLNVKPYASVIFEGATADSYESTFTPEEPTADNTVTMPNDSGGLPMVIYQSGSSVWQTVNATESGATITIPANWLTTGKSLRWTIYGFIDGVNADKKLGLQYGNTSAATEFIGLPIEAGSESGFVAQFLVHARTGTTQHAFGDFQGWGAGGTTEAVYASAPITAEAQLPGTIDSTAAQNFWIDVTSGNAADFINVYNVIVETFTRSN